LEELVEQYPYFASARVLLAKALHSANDHRFDDALQMAAVFAGDRKVLYNLMLKEGLAKRIRDVDEAVSGEVEEEEEPEAKVESKSTESDGSKPSEVESESNEIAEKVEPESSESEEVSIPVKPQPKLDEEELAEEEAQVEETDSEEAEEVEEEESDKKRVYDEYEQEILYEAINSSISKEVSEEEEKEESPDQAEISHEEVSKTSREKPAELEKPHSYSEWLRRRASEIHYYDQSGAEQREKKIANQSESASGADEEEEEKPRQDELIAKFIDREPKITPRKADMFSSDNLAKMSVVEDESFVTETMAKIFARQGNIRKAKRAYKLLSLKYPEKSIYFANQIKKLQGKK
jgi:hypothetical protein